MILPAVTLVVASMLQAGPVAPVDVGPASTRPFALDFTGLKADGSPGATVSGLEFEFKPPTGTAVLVRFPLVPVVGANTVLMSTALKDVPGGLFEMRGRWYDPAGQPSAFSEPPLAIRNHVNPPAAPGPVTVPDDDS